MNKKKDSLNLIVFYLNKLLFKIYRAKLKNSHSLIHLEKKMSIFIRIVNIYYLKKVKNKNYKIQHFAVEFLVL